MKVITVKPKEIAIELVEVLAKHRLWICTAESILDLAKEFLREQEVVAPPKREPKQTQPVSEDGETQ